MMIRVVPFEVCHAKFLISQDKTGFMGKYIEPQHLLAVSQSKMAYTGMVGGSVVFCGGVIRYWDNRGEAWAIFGRDVKQHFIGIHNAVRRFLAVCPLRRVEATVYADFKEGHRWVRALGFRVEGERLRGFFPDGKDATLFSRVNNSV
jgi:hypothetical protein